MHQQHDLSASSDPVMWRYGGEKWWENPQMKRTSSVRNTHSPTEASEDGCHWGLCDLPALGPQWCLGCERVHVHAWSHTKVSHPTVKINDELRNGRMWRWVKKVLQYSCKAGYKCFFFPSLCESLTTILISSLVPTHAVSTIFCTYKDWSPEYVRARYLTD